MIVTLVLAAGRGERFSKGKLRKQFESINGIPMFIHALRPYLDPTISAKVVLAINSANLGWTEEQLNHHGIRDEVNLAVGGDTRQESIEAAYRFASNTWQLSPRDAIVLHNAASPNVSVTTIRKCIEGLRDADMVQPYTPQLRTQIMLGASGVAGIPDRKSFGVNCDPTAYRAASLNRVIEQMESEGMSGDSTIDLAFSLGLSIGTVVEDSSNIKVTTPWDLAAIRAAMAEQDSEREENNGPQRDLRGLSSHDR